MEGPAEASTVRVGSHGLEGRDDPARARQLAQGPGPVQVRRRRHGGGDTRQDARERQSRRRQKRQSRHDRVRRLHPGGVQAVRVQNQRGRRRGRGRSHHLRSVPDAVPGLRQGS